jgi:putative redox protein
MDNMNKVTLSDKSTNETIGKAVGRLISQIQEKPDSSIIEPLINSELVNGFQSNTTIRNFNITVDEPVALGGTDKGPNPVELVLGALASCKEIVIKAYAVALGIPVTSVKVVSKGKLDLKGFLNLDEETRPGFKEVDYRIEIKSTESNPEKLKQLETLIETKCPVHDIIQNSVKLNGKIEFIK